MRQFGLIPTQAVLRALQLGKDGPAHSTLETSGSHRPAHYPEKKRAPFFRWGGILWVILVWGLLACGPSAEEIDQRIERRVQEILTALPTPTPVPFPTPLPTATPAPTATPQPSPTPVVLPPTPTPIVLPPEPTPQPTVTPQPLAMPPGGLDFSEIHQSVWRAVFFIDTLRRDGSGWLVEPGLILTNEHVVRGSNTVTVRQAIDPPFPARVLATDAWRDIALLEFDQAQAQLPPGTQPLPLGQVSNNNVAQALLALGYSGTIASNNGTVGLASANVGVLSQITNFGFRTYGSNLVMDVPVDPGDSGGPVLNGSGEVVGMTRAVTEQTSGGQRVVGTFFAVHIDEIREALPGLKRGESR